ncbi:MAG: YraN family protein [Candidatus Paceibacterota bacterium]
MPKNFTSEKQKIGKIGENIACRFLVKRGFVVLDSNYTKKWGEIDIITKKEGKLHFIEVKSINCQNNQFLNSNSYVTCETDRTYRPEENMHPWKTKRMSRIIQTYLLSKKINENVEWQVDLLIVYLNLKDKKAKIKVVDNIII